ncbi:MAG: hypothetical protein ACRD18_17530 [Terriglobia bacterium]
MLRATVTLLILGNALLLTSTTFLGQQSPKSAKSASQDSGKKLGPGVMKTDVKGVRHFAPAEAASNYLPPNIAPASCDEWAILTIPEPHDVGTKCKMMPHSGVNYCWRAESNQYGAHYGGQYDIGPMEGEQKVGVPLTVHFRIRNFGSGDYVIYSFGKVDWGDNSQQDIVPFNVDVPLTHTYYSQRAYVIHAMGGQQFHYQNGPGSGSYEACVDNSIPVTITP